LRGSGGQERTEAKGGVALLGRREVREGKKRKNGCKEGKLSHRETSDDDDCLWRYDATAKPFGCKCMDNPSIIISNSAGMQLRAAVGHLHCQQRRDSDIASTHVYPKRNSRKIEPGAEE
jgi:hypothetical protein